MVWPIIREMRSFRVASSYFGRGIRESTKGGVLVWRRQNAPFCLPSYPPYVLMSSRAGGERGGRAAGRQFSMSANAWLRQLSCSHLGRDTKEEPPRRRAACICCASFYRPKDGTAVKCLPCSVTAAARPVSAPELKAPVAVCFSSQAARKAAASRRGLSLPASALRPTARPSFPASSSSSLDGAPTRCSAARMRHTVQDECSSRALVRSSPPLQGCGAHWPRHPGARP